MSKAPETKKSHMFSFAWTVRGVSDRTVDMHMALYEGHVNAPMS